MALEPLSAFSTNITTAEVLQTTVPWWQHALPPDLGEQVDAALGNNLSVRVAERDVARFKAELDQASAILEPSLSATATADARRNDDDERSSSRFVRPDANFPLDFFGQLKADEQTQIQELAAARASLNQVTTEQALNYVLGYIDAAEADAQKALLEQQADVAGTLLRLAEFRFVQGLASSVDVLQQREQLASLEQQFPVFEGDRQVALRQLELLSGQLPHTLSKPAPLTLPAVADRYAVVTPAELLERRPQLVRAKYELAASDYRFEAALRDRLPSISLSVDAIRFSSGDVTGFVSAALSGAFDFLDGGRKVAIARQRRVELEQAGIRYVEAWLTALNEIETLLLTAASQAEQMARLRQRLQVADDLLRASRQRYERGVSDYLPVLGALRNQQQLQRDEVALLSDQMRTRARLHSALGLPEVNESGDQTSNAE